MKTSVLIIAHNEESHIRECIESVLHQSQKADEIVLIAHNCTDGTVKIAREYPSIILYALQTKETWPVPAREYGFTQATGDIIACVDGDSYTSPTWLAEIVRPLSRYEITSVSGFPILLANHSISYIWFLQWLPILKRLFPFYFWGSNFACRKKDYEEVGWMKKCREIWEILWLHYPAEDCILSFLLQERGEIAFARKAKSYVSPWKFFEWAERWKKQSEDLKKIRKYFGK